LEAKVLFLKGFSPVSLSRERLLGGGLKILFPSVEDVSMDVQFSGDLFQGDALV
jgi:hypothetical protein